MILITKHKTLQLVRKVMLTCSVNGVIIAQYVDRAGLRHWGIEECQDCDQSGKIYGVGILLKCRVI